MDKINSKPFLFRGTSFISKQVSHAYMRLITTILPSIKITHFLSLGVGTLYYFEIGHTNFTFGGTIINSEHTKITKTVLGVAEVITKYQNMRV